MAPTFVRSVTLKNYKSIARCKVTLQPITYLVVTTVPGRATLSMPFAWLPTPCARHSITPFGSAAA